MRKNGLVFLVLLLLVALISAPVLAKPGSGSNSSGAASAKGSSASNNQVIKNLPDKSNPAAISKDKAIGQEKRAAKADREKSIPSSNRLQNIPVEQKQQIINKFHERQKQIEKKEFTDSSTHWANKDIAKIQSLGLISGYKDGTFKPDAEVSNVEAMSMVVNLADTVNGGDVENQTETPVDNQEPEISEEISNSDVPEWAKKSATKALSLKIININRFHSQVQVSRAQVAVMLAKALKLEPVTGDEVGFTDTKYISSEDIGYILALKQACIVNGSPDGRFNPNNAITRAELAAMLANVVEAIEENNEENINEDENSTDPATGDDTTTDTEQTLPPTTDMDNTVDPAPIEDNTTDDTENNDAVASGQDSTSSPQN